MKSSAWLWIGLALLAVLLVAGVAVAVGSRGFRNKNPGNLRPLPGGVKWQGQVGVDSGNYLIFDSFSNGYRAMTRDLKTKISRGLDTIEKILPVYAPKEDNNNVAAYIASVEKYSGIPRGQRLSPDNLLPIVRAMARHEVGAVDFAKIPESDLQSGVARA